MKKEKLKKSIAVLLAAAITFSNFSGIGSLQEVKAASTVTINNNSFETTTTNNSGKQIASSWSQHSSAEVVSTGAQSGSKCLKITNNSSTVTEVTQTIQLEESTEYVLTGYIKGENISGVNSAGGDFGDGATIDFDEDTAYMVDHTNNWAKGTFGWKQVKVYFVTPSNPNGSTVKVKLRCRLGHMWGNASGTAYFDNISIQKQAYPTTGTDRVKIERANVSAYIKKEIVDDIGYNAYCNWIDDVQKTYESYKELTGSYPYNGDKVIIIDTDEPMIQQYGGIANFNPILISGKQERNFEDYAKDGYINFGILHEMGHVFDKKSNNTDTYSWNFNSEFWANTKMLYVLDNEDGVNVNKDNEIRATKGSELSKLYKEMAPGSYDNKIGAGIFDNDSNDALTYVFLKIIDKIGWEPFKATFRQYVNGEVVTPMTTFGKFNKFLCLLQENYNPNGTEVMDCIGERDFNIIRKGMEGGDSSYFSKFLSYSSVIEGNSNFENYVSGGNISGTEGKNKKITKLSIKTLEKSGISYRVYINGAWTEWKNGGSSVDGNGNDIEAIQIKLSGELASTCDVYYRTHNRYYGWMGWTSNGATAGTRNMGSAIEGYQIQLVEKGTTVAGITNDTKEACKEKCKVVFKDYDGTILSEQNVEYGASAKAPSNPTRAGYNFTRWAGSYTNVTSDIEIIAQYERDIKIISVDINGGADVIAGQKAYIKINTNCTDNVVYSVDIRSIAGNMQLANNVSNNVIEWIPSESYAGAHCTIEIAVRDSYLSGSSVLYTAYCSVKKKTENITTIYYKGYENPYIHYQIGNGAWTKAPGIKMEANSDVEGYNYAITLDLGTASTLTACFNDGNGNWDSNNQKNYTFGTGYYTYSNQKMTKINKPEKELKITNLAASPENSIVSGQQVIFKTETKDAQGTVKYKYTATSSSGTTSILRDYSTYNEFSWLPGTVGKYKITVYVTDGVTTQEKTIDYEVTEFKNVSVSKLESSLGTEVTLGNTTNISMEAKDGYSTSYYYSVKVNGTEILPDKTTSSASWTPSQTGSYTVVATVTDARGIKAEKTMTINVVEGNTTTIYYKGYTNPNIHYRIGNGAWTSVPGVKMEANSDVDGYNYAITIDLGAATSLTACFNDGNNNWDSNNSNNYVFGTGYYTYSNQKITKIEKPSAELRINSIASSCGDSMSMGASSDITINAAGGEGPYTYTMYYSLYGSGKARYLLNKSSNNTVAFTPDYPRKITLYVTVTDAAGTTVNAQKVIDVKEVSQNQVTIYYKGYSNPNIHYKVGNGNWTNVPGVKMEASSKVSGYPYAITIDLGDDTNLTACFNDGNGNWDSANGNNYNFNIGEYTYSNGNITKIN